MISKENFKMYRLALYLPYPGR